MTELDDLISAATNAAFDCGEWDGDIKAEYDELLAHSTAARKALKDYIAKNYRLLE